MQSSSVRKSAIYIVLQQIGVQVIAAETEQGRGILGVVDGFSPRGVENADEVKARHNFLRQIGYKL